MRSSISARQVGGEQAGRPAGVGRQDVLEQHREAVRLLAAARGAAPDRQPALGGAGPDELRQHVLLHRVERVVVAEERRLVGRHGVDDAAGERRRCARRASARRGSAIDCSPSLRASGTSRDSTRYSLPGSSTIAECRRTTSRM